MGTFADPDGPAERAMSAALRLLKHRARSRHELELALGRRGFSGEVAQATLRRLEELGYLDDVRLARFRAAALLGEGRLGVMAVRQRLLAQGLPEEAADAALRQARQEVDYDPLASGRRLLERRRLWGRPLEERERGRIARLLSSRGFSEEEIEALLRLASALDPEGQGG